MNLNKWLRPQGDRIAAVACLVVGAAILLAGWLGMSRTPYPAEQMPYIVSGGIACIAGVFVLGLLVPEFARYDARNPTP